MINHTEIKQGSYEWFEIKHAKIGGTLSSGLFVKSDSLLIDILSQRLEEFESEDSFQTPAMERGSMLEPDARNYLIQYTGIDFKETGWLQSTENELLGISPDGLSECETKACEIKSFGRKKHYEVLLLNQEPLENVAQIVHYFTVNKKLEELHFIAYRPEAPNHFIKLFTLKTEVNLGTKAKPKMMTILEARDTALELANNLLEDIKIEEKQLSF